MVEDVTDESSMTQERSRHQQFSTARAHWYSPPIPIKRIFDNFPLVTLSANKLPRRSPQDRRKNTLHVFASDHVALQGGPSYNPSCLKWQAYLKFAGINFVTTSSNNHAAPGGSLPFLLPGSSNSSPPSAPISFGKIDPWTIAQTGSEEEETGMRYEAYASLLDHRIRNAWLYHLYLDAENFKAVATPLYIATASSNMFVQYVLGRQLQQAAREELGKYTSVIDGQELLDKADKAFEALSTLLGEREFFFGHARPGLFDASVFAYTHLLVSDQMKWKNAEMTNSFEKYGNLVDHQRRLYTRYFSR